MQVSIDDADFRSPTYAEIDRTAGTYAVELDGLAPGERTIFVRALRDRFSFPIASKTVSVTGGPGPRPGSVPGALEVQRVFGQGRIETAIELSRRGFDSADSVVLARADQFPDALTAATLAAEVDGPVLLTPVNELAPAVEAEIDRLGATTVYLAGGPEALDPTVDTAAQSDGRQTVRLAGIDRFETAALLVSEAIAQGATPNPTILASGANFPDALAAVPVSHALGGVTVLVDPNALSGSPSTAQLLTDNAAAIRTLLIAGGVEAISDTVRDDVTNLLTDATE